MRVMLEVTIVPKEEETWEGAEPGNPDPDLLVSYVRSHLADESRRDSGIGWMITDVQRRP